MRNSVFGSKFGLLVILAALFSQTLLYADPLNDYNQAEASLNRIQNDEIRIQTLKTEKTWSASHLVADISGISCAAGFVGGGIILGSLFTDGLLPEKGMKVAAGAGVGGMFVGCPTLLGSLFWKGSDDSERKSAEEAAQSELEADQNAYATSRNNLRGYRESDGGTAESNAPGLWLSLMNDEQSARNSGYFVH